MQTGKRRLIFICTVNRMRSATAHKIYLDDPRFEVDSAGTDRTANVVLEDWHLEWADAIVVMEKHHRNAIRSKFPDLYEKKPIVCLYIEDIYDFIAGADRDTEGQVRGRLSSWATELIIVRCPSRWRVKPAMTSF